MIGLIINVENVELQNEMEVQMKRLTREQSENRIISKIIHRIMQLEKHYEPKFVERACMKYKMAMAGKRKALQQKKKLEEELAQINRRLR
jgi:hypothetical protein